MNYGFTVKTEYPVDLIDWAKDTRERLDKENEEERAALFGGLANMARAGVAAKMYNQQQNEYNNAMKQAYAAKQSGDDKTYNSIMTKYGIDPDDFSAFSKQMDTEAIYNNQVNQRKNVDAYLRNGKGISGNTFEVDPDLLSTGYYVG